MAKRTFIQVDTSQDFIDLVDCLWLIDPKSKNRSEFVKNALYAYRPELAKAVRLITIGAATAGDLTNRWLVEEREKQTQEDVRK